jgi:hypothetical protein
MTPMPVTPIRVLGAIVGVLLSVGLAAADVVTEWNVHAIAATAVLPNSILQSRTLAITHAAMSDAINAIERRYAPYAVDVTAPAGASVDAAGAAAAHGVLVRLAPGHAATLDAALKSALARVADERAREAGASLGRQVAEQMVERRARDGSDANVTVSDGTSVDRWVPTPPLSLAPILTQWGGVTPFLVPNAAQLPVKDPPGLPHGGVRA